MTLRNRSFRQAFLCVTVGLLAISLWFSDATATGQEAEAPDTSGAAAASNASETSSPPFAQVYEEWKGLLKQLRDLQKKYPDADESELEGIQQEFDGLIERVHQMVPTLRAAAVEAYRKAPNVDRELTQFLVKLIEDDVSYRDDYDSAAELAQVLIDNGCEESGLFNWAGIIAFVNNDFDAAEKYLKNAEEAGTLKDAGSTFLSDITTYRQFWEEEKAIREKEAAADDLPRVKIETTKGDIVVELFENEAPQTVGNFINLVEKGFYDGLTFHRVLPGFMAQSGCPKGDGTGGPGYNIYCECYKDGYRKHFRGTLSMAKEEGRNTGGSQFFLTFVPTPHLNGKHTAFGRVIEGMDVLSELRRIDPTGEKAGSEAEPDKIIVAEVLRKRDHEYVPTKVQ